MVQDVIKVIIELIIVCGCFLFGRYALPMLKTSKYYDTVKVLVAFIDKFVLGVEQTMTAKKAGKKKLAAVTALATSKAKELGLDISDDDMRMLIEASVKAMNDGEASVTTEATESK